MGPVVGGSLLQALSSYNHSVFHAWLAGCIMLLPPLEGRVVHGERNILLEIWNDPAWHGQRLGRWWERSSGTGVGGLHVQHVILCARGTRLHVHGIRAPNEHVR